APPRAANRVLIRPGGPPPGGRGAPGFVAAEKTRLARRTEHHVAGQPGAVVAPNVLPQPVEREFASRRERRGQGCKNAVQFHAAILWPFSPRMIGAGALPSCSLWRASLAVPPPQSHALGGRGFPARPRAQQKSW